MQEILNLIYTYFKYMKNDLRIKKEFEDFSKTVTIP